MAQSDPTYFIIALSCITIHLPNYEELHDNRASEFFLCFFEEHQFMSNIKKMVFTGEAPFKFQS